MTAILVAVVVGSVFSSAIGNDFVSYDDAGYVYGNAVTRRGLTWANVVTAVTTPVLLNYHPVTWLSHMADVQMWGLAPAGHHLTSVLLHALCAALLFLWLTRVTGRSGAAVVVALVFALHPLRVESVAWVSERKDVLSGVFLLMCLLARQRHRELGSARWSAAMHGFGVLALLSKPTTVPLPLALYLVDTWIERAPPAPLRWLRRNAAFVAAAAVAAGLTVVLQDGARVDAELPALLRLQTGLMAIGSHYVVGHQLWPIGLHAPYHYRESWPLAEVVFGGVVLVVVSVLGWRWRFSRPSVLFGWTWALLFLLPVIGIIPVGIAAAADRYTFLPSIGLWIAVVYAWPTRTRASVIVGLALAATALVGEVAVTRRQIEVWKDSTTLFRAAVAAEPDNAHALMMLANELPRAEALPLLDRAIASRPGLAAAHRLRGKLRLRGGDADAAIASFVDALTLDPKDGCSHLLLAAALVGRDPTSARSEMARGLSRCDDSDASRMLAAAWRSAGSELEAAAVEAAVATGQ